MRNISKATRFAGSRGFWRWLSVSVAAGVGVFLLSVALLPKGTSSVCMAQASPKPPANLGSWTAPQKLNVCAIHSALLANGNVLLFYYDYPFGSKTGTAADVWNPVTGVDQMNNFSSANPPLLYDIFCSGMSQLPDGTLLVAGGRDDSKPKTDTGIHNGTLYSPATHSWSATTNMNYWRWYPTNIELADGTTLVANGTDDNENTVIEMETYDYTAKTWTVLPASANMSPTSFIYPRFVLLPTGDVFKGGMEQQSMIFNPTTNTWSNSASMNYGQRIYGGMVLLPGLVKVLAVGGNPDLNQMGTATNTVEEIDTSATTPTWKYVAPMNLARQNENLVLLPDGTVMAVGGGSGGTSYSNPVMTPEIYNPTLNTWTEMAPNAVQRTYHSTALLLPDGRVISAGSDSGLGTTARTLEVFSPPYLSSGTRPTITTPPTKIHYGRSFNIMTPDASSITQVALIKLGSNTHATRFDERFVSLTFSINPKGTMISATAPASGNYAPPGYYMLDIVNSSGVPAVMPILSIGN